MSAAALFLCRAHLYTVRRALTAWRAVAFIEIIFSLLKIRMMAGSHLRSMRRFKTARVVWRAVANKEINSSLLKARIDGGQS
jgi:hypothetical protein